MSVDSIRYCLERATDSRAYELLCCDVLSCDGYASIEPIGGTGDGGRDALHKASEINGLTTIFAFSLRKDWKAKLREDCDRIKELGHVCDSIVFAFVTQPTPNERDALIASVKSDYGWRLRLYGLERLRTQLSGPSNHLLSAYPSIFSPRFFEHVAGELVGKEQRDLIVIDHDESDIAFASWLARRIEIAGYNVCCIGLAPFGGLNVDESVRTLIQYRAARYIAVLSKAGTANQDLRGRCEVAVSIPHCLLPLTLDGGSSLGLSNRIQQISAISFAESWSDGFTALMEVFHKHCVPVSWNVQSGRATALSSVIPESLTKDEPETLYSNTFPVVTIPDAVLTVPLRRIPNPLQLQQLREDWAFVLVGTNALSFQYPPSHDLINDTNRFTESSHARTQEYLGRRTYDVITELARRCMELACFRAGLKWCPDRELIYFPREDQDSRRIEYIDVSGKKRRTGMTGKKSLFRPGPQPNESYRYFVAPRFFVSGASSSNTFEIRLRLFLRITDASDTALAGRAVTSRRKAAAKNWFNQHWFAKTLAAIQFIGDGDLITIGAAERTFQVSTVPKSWECPISIDSDAVKRMMTVQKETRSALLQFESALEASDE